jgi:phosphonate transport system substrate-binding protein
MKTQKFLGQAGRLRNVIVVAALAASFALPTVASAAVSVKSGDACSKSQLNKTSGTFKCTYNSKTKKYTWAASAKTKARAGWPTKLVVAAVPSENAASMTLRYQNFVKLIEKETGLPTSFFAATDYAGAIEAQVAGRVDLVFYGPFSYVLAKARGAKIEPIGAAISTPTAKPGYYSYGLAKASNSAVNSIKDFKGKKVCFVDAASTSGYLYPIAGLLANSVTDRDYTSVLAGGHDKSALAVAAGTCDVGFAYDDMVDVNLIEKGLLKKGELKVVWKSETIAGSPMAVRIDLPKDLVQILKTAVLEKANKPSFVKAGYCTDEATCRIIEDGSWGFTKVDDAYYDGIRQVCEATKSSRCR